MGKTMSQIIAIAGKPCENNNNVLRYCIVNGDIIAYVFRENKLADILFMTLCASKYKAEIEMEKAVNSFARSINETPIRRGELYYFERRGGVSVSISITNNKSEYYVKTQYSTF